MKKFNRNGGFTLIELLIVIAVIAILAALAIPNLIGSRKAANETSAIAQLRTILTAQESYKGRNLGSTTTGGTANAYATLALLETASLVSWPTPATYKKSGYTFADLTPAPSATNTTQWGTVGTPQDTNSGDRNFVSTNDGFVRAQASSVTAPTTIAAAIGLTAIQ